MYDHFQLTGILLLVGALNAPSTTSDSITVSWTAPQSLPTGYMLTPVCMLLCGDPLQITSMTATSSSTPVTFSGIPPGSECNITLTAQGSFDSSYEPMVTATTLSESEHALVIIHMLLCLYFCVHFCDKQSHQQHPLALLFCQRTAHPSPSHGMRFHVLIRMGISCNITLVTLLMVEQPPLLHCQLEAINLLD